MSGPAAADDAFAPAAAQGIHRLAVPTPFMVGRVNVYVIEDEPLTLVDTGPNSGRSLDALEQGLRGLGHAIEDLGLVLVSHQHIDHLGLVEIIRRRAGAEVAAIEPLAEFMTDYAAAAAADDDFAGEVMLRHGIPADVSRALQAVSAAFRGWGGGSPVDRVLRDGERLALRERTFEVLHRPGHSPTDTVFVDHERRTMLAADHLLAKISSNPLISRLPGDEGRPQSLAVYIDSLARTRDLDLALTLPGHGDPITGHRDLIDARFAMHRRRADRFHRLIAERERTAYEMAQATWGDIALTQAYLTLSEVLGHTDLLVNEGRVEEIERDGVVRFRSVADPPSRGPEPGNARAGTG